MRPPAASRRGVHDGSVARATRMSPGDRAAVAGSVTMSTLPSTEPADTPTARLWSRMPECIDASSSTDRANVHGCKARPSLMTTDGNAMCRRRKGSAAARDAATAARHSCSGRSLRSRYDSQKTSEAALSRCCEWSVTARSMAHSCTRPNMVDMRNLANSRRPPSSRTRRAKKRRMRARSEPNQYDDSSFVHAPSSHRFASSTPAPNASRGDGAAGSSRARRTSVRTDCTIEAGAWRNRGAPASISLGAR
mmetsp:Transcript_4001/g.13025  ORF Transcript_4001/g.13025 Transcript_4001/m.13025 type:complete len:250 (+) Transcript_4001:188-937(+)